MLTLLNFAPYMLYVFSCLTCSLASRASCLTCSTVNHYGMLLQWFTVVHKLCKPPGPINLRWPYYINSSTWFLVSSKNWNQWLNRNISLKFETSRFGLWTSWSNLNFSFLSVSKIRPLLGPKYSWCFWPSHYVNFLSWKKISSNR